MTPTPVTPKLIYTDARITGASRGSRPAGSFPYGSPDLRRLRASRLISPPTPIPGISAGQGYPTEVSPGLQGPLDGCTQLDLAAALDQLVAVYWQAGFPARR